MSDPRDEFISKVLLSESQVLSFDGFIFLCGGRIDVSSPRPVSVRESLRRQLAKRADLEARVRLAESYNDWSAEGHYGDLLVFEDHIAQLSAVIVLVLESPGSLAELGLFSALPDFREKLLVFVSNHHYAESSFVRLGPIKYLEDTLGNRVECYPWIKIDFGREVFDHEELAKIEDELMQSLLDRLTSPSGDAIFSKKVWLHQALLICELVGVMSALTITEIKGYLDELELELSAQQLRQLLFMLEKMEMLSVESRSNQRFYVSRLDKNFIRWKSKEGVVDKGRFRFKILEHYEAKDKKRFRALQRARRGVD